MENRCLIYAQASFNYKVSLLLQLMWHPGYASAPKDNLFR